MISQDDARKARMQLKIDIRIVTERWAKTANLIRRQPSFLRYIEFSIGCTLLNLFGLWATQQSTSAMFYFDSIGTALASMIAGPTNGVITALSTSIAGSFLIERPEHVVTGFTNMSCALVWGIAPRLGANWLGADIFKYKEIGGYLRLISRVFLLGLLCGTVAATVSLFAQISFFDLTADINNRTITVLSSGSAVSKNNFLLMAAIFQASAIPKWADNIYSLYWIASLLAHWPDKIVATITAATLAMAFFRTPNIRLQIRAINRRIVAVEQFYNSKRLFVFAVLIFYGFLLWPLIWPYLGISFFKVAPRISMKTWSWIFMAFFALLTILVLPYRASLFKVVDPHGPPVRALHRSAVHEFYTSGFLGQKLPFQRDAFEDTIKTLTITFAVSQFLALKTADIGSAGGSYASVQKIVATIDGVSIDASMPSIYSMVTFNILLMTGFRYFFVILLRFFGRF